MKLRIFASLVAASMAFVVSVPVVAASDKTHESISTCRTDEATGLTHCFASEADIKSKEMPSGATDGKVRGTTHATVTDAAGNIVSSYDASINERYRVLLASDGSTQNMKINISLSEEIMEAGVTSCTRTHVVIRGDTERVNEVTTTPGPC